MSNADKAENFRRFSPSILSNITASICEEEWKYKFLGSGKGSVTPARAPALPTPAPALLDSPRGGAPPAPRKTAVWTAMTPPHGAMTPPDAMTPPLA
ncbi:uncharacterized protein F5147DRAFT_777726 [Suillus discolor]|uniref:Uncharacterized protein n=1 Tax=Suillus discolor TaxID=1912936 RepID=A0A9P7EYN5_9AGAM|nr:uncharacterized protein F5147DRAFT_777726 [Suillus discolor]KAG2098231.1 hypothetical protein F5147DRAFT_777726 [Suillus discolor]